MLRDGRDHKIVEVSLAHSRQPPAQKTQSEKQQETQQPKSRVHTRGTNMENPIKAISPSAPTKPGHTEAGNVEAVSGAVVRKKLGLANLHYKTDRANAQRQKL